MADILHKRAMHLSPRGSVASGEAEDNPEVDMILLEARKEVSSRVGSYRSMASASGSPGSYATAQQRFGRTFEVNTERGGKRIMSEEEVSSLVHSALQRARKATSYSISPRKRTTPFATSSSPGFANSSSPGFVNSSSPGFANSSPGFANSSPNFANSSSPGFPNSKPIPSSDPSLQLHLPQEDDRTPPSGYPKSRMNTRLPQSKYSIASSFTRSLYNERNTVVTQNSSSADSPVELEIHGSKSDESRSLKTENSSDAIIRRVEEEIANARKAAMEANRRLAGVNKNLPIPISPRYREFGSFGCDDAEEEHFDSAMDLIDEEFQGVRKSRSQDPPGFFPLNMDGEEIEVDVANGYNGHISNTGSRESKLSFDTAHNGYEDLLIDASNEYGSSFICDARTPMNAMHKNMESTATEDPQHSIKRDERAAINASPDPSLGRLLQSFSDPSEGEELPHIPSQEQEHSKSVMGTNFRGEGTPSPENKRAMPQEVKQVPKQFSAQGNVFMRMMEKAMERAIEEENPRTDKALHGFDFSLRQDSISGPKSSKKNDNSAEVPDFEMQDSLSESRSNDPISADNSFSKAEDGQDFDLEKQESMSSTGSEEQKSPVNNASQEVIDLTGVDSVGSSPYHDSPSEFEDALGYEEVSIQEEKSEDAQGFEEVSVQEQNFMNISSTEEKPDSREDKTAESICKEHEFVGEEQKELDEGHIKEVSDSDVAEVDIDDIILAEFRGEGEEAPEMDKKTDSNTEAETEPEPENEPNDVESQETNGIVGNEEEQDGEVALNEEMNGDVCETSPDVTSKQLTVDDSSSEPEVIDSPSGDVGGEVSHGVDASQTNQDDSRLTPAVFDGPSSPLNATVTGNGKTLAEAQLHFPSPQKFDLDILSPFNGSSSRPIAINDMPPESGSDTGRLVDLTSPLSVTSPQPQVALDIPQNAPATEPTMQDTAHPTFANTVEIVDHPQPQPQARARDARAAISDELGISETRKPDNLVNSRKVQFRQRYPVPPQIALPRPDEEIIKDNQAAAVNIDLSITSNPKRDLEELLEAATGKSLQRRSNACGALKILSVQKRNRFALVRTKGFLDAVVYAASADISPDEYDAAIDARTRAVQCILNSSELKENRNLVFSHPNLPQCLVKCMIEDKGEARVTACSALATLAKTAANREPMVRVDKLIDSLAMILKGANKVKDAQPDPVHEEKTTVLSDEEGSTVQHSFSSGSSHSSTLEHGSTQSHSTASSASTASSVEEDLPSTTSMGETDRERSLETLNRARLSACAVLVHLSKQCSVTPILCSNKFLMDTLVDAASQYEDPLHTKCLEIFCNLSRFPSNNGTMARHPTLINALVSNGKSRDDIDRVWSLRTFQNLSSHLSGKTVLANSVVLELLSISLMRKNLEEQIAATATIYNLSTEPGAVVPLTNTKNVVATLVHVAHSPDSHSAVRLMSCDALATLGLWLQTLAGAGTVPTELKEDILLPSYVTAGWQRWD